MNVHALCPTIMVRVCRSNGFDDMKRNARGRGAGDLPGPVHGEEILGVLRRRPQLLGYEIGIGIVMQRTLWQPFPELSQVPAYLVHEE